MIRFFRQIRQKLLNNGHVSRYFLYAIGEILLVVFGILIALHLPAREDGAEQAGINNWNTQRIQNNNSLHLGERLLAETERNIDSLEDQFKAAEGSKTSALKIMHLMSPDYSKVQERLMDSLVYELYKSSNLLFNSVVLSEAFSTGEVSNFKNDSLKSLIYSLPSEIESIRVHEQSLREVNLNLAALLNEKFSLRQMDYRFSSNQQELGVSKLPKMDNRRLLSNQQFENIVNELYYQLNALLVIYETLSYNFDRISELLKQKLEA